MIHRDPKGHFIGQDRMASAWLPQFMDWMYGDANVHVLGICASWYVKVAAREIAGRSKWLDRAAHPDIVLSQLAKENAKLNGQAAGDSRRCDATEGDRMMEQRKDYGK